MQVSQLALTIFGALALFLSTNGLAPESAKALSKEECPSGLESSEQFFGQHKFQVNRLVVNAPPEQVQSILTDYDRTTRIFSEVKKCQVLETNGPAKLIAFSACAPGNLFTFDYVLEVLENPGYIEWHRVSGSFRDNQGFWKLEPVDEGRSTLVTYAKYVDGGLLFPQLLVNQELRASMPEVMTNLKASAESQSRVANYSQRMR